MDQSTTDLSTQEALIGLIISVMASDGSIAEEEIHEFNLIAERSSTLHGMSAADLTDAVDRMYKNLEEGGFEPMINACVKALPETMYTGVFALACELVCADGLYKAEEMELLRILQDKLNITSEQAEVITEVIATKSRI
jgi:uncharacterized tellurite resistance protein B-like protein